MNPFDKTHIDCGTSIDWGDGDDGHVLMKPMDVFLRVKDGKPVGVMIDYSPMGDGELASDYLTLDEAAELRWCLDRALKKAKELK